MSVTKNAIATFITLVVVLVAMAYVIPYFNDKCLKPQFVEAHLKNCNLLSVEDSCLWLKDNAVYEDYGVDKSAVVKACNNSREITELLVKYASKGKIGGE